MDISEILDPVNQVGFQFQDEIPSHPRLGDLITIYRDPEHFPNYHSVDIALLGINEDRNAFNNRGCGEAANAIRKYLYALYPAGHEMKIVDLGNIRPGFQVSDTYFALTEVVSEMLQNNVLPVLIGGSHDFTFANYQAYQNLGQIVNIVAVDPMFDLGQSEEEMNSRSYLSHIILQQPNYLFTFANIGYQSYFTDEDALRLLKNLMFDTYRLGMVRSNLEEAEPAIRNADIMSVDISAVRFSDAPGNGNATPNGFYGEEICQLVRYAGLSDKLSSIGFYETNPTLDPNGQTAHLVAQMIWYFIDGFYNRAHDFPFRNEDDYMKYRVSIHDHKEDLTFFKSKKTDRWWMEIPLESDLRMKYQRHYLVPCSYQDYQMACNNDIPDRWWMVYQKLM